MTLEIGESSACRESRESRQYLRPNDRWVCGQAEFGCPCRMGPSPSGECGARFQCQPIKRGDRWICRRPEELGGPCAQGPDANGACCSEEPKCVPKPALKTQRFKVTLYLLSLIIALHFILLNGNNFLNYISPGELNAVHASVAQCQDCHRDTANRNISDLWSVALFSALTSNHERHNEACLDCHEAGRMPHLAHGRSGAMLRELANLGEGRDDRMGKEKSEPIEARDDGVLASHEESAGRVVPCAQCHREHDGPRNALDVVPNTLCNSCHTRTISHFSEPVTEGGHPELGRYPYDRRHSLYFDHYGHFTRHFTRKEKIESGEAPTRCISCHTPGEDGRRMGQVGFSSCADCHADDVLSESLIQGARGIAVLEIPGWDLETLAARGYSVGEWPAWAESTINPFWALLLSNDEQTRQAIEKVSGIDNMDLSSADEDTLSAVKTVSWAIKRWLFELEQRGMSALTDDRNRLLRGLPREEIVAANREWFPKLEQELKETGQGEKGGVVVEQKRTVEISGRDSDIGSDGDGNSIFLSESESLGDLGGLLDGGGLLEENGLLEETELLEETDLLAGTDLLETVGLDEASLEDASLDDSILDVSILGESGLDDDTLGSDIFGDDDISNLFELDEDNSAESVLQPLSAEEWVAQGGWYWQEHALYYRPGGHADPTLKRWWSMAVEQTWALPLLTVLNGEESAGRCGKCHIGHQLQNDDEQLEMRWKSLALDYSAAPFTPFSHRTHFNIGMEQGCGTCHRLKTLDSKERLSEAIEDDRGGVSSFKSMEKSQCATCHSKELAISDCQTCHRYHPQPRGERRVSSDLELVR